LKPNRREFLVTMASAAAWAPPLLAAAPSGAIWSARQLPQVVSGHSASEPVQFAAQQLQHYLKLVLGGTASSGSNVRIALREVNDKDLGDEGFEISSNHQTVTISGAPLGIVFGTFEFLRRFAGCQFSGLGPECEYVPRLKSIDVDIPQLRMKPQLWYRAYQFFYAEPLDLVIKRLDWMVRNGVNYVMFTPHRDDLSDTWGATDPVNGMPASAPNFYFTERWWKEKVQPEVLKRGLKLDFNHHNLFYWLPPSRYFKDHPEWYPLVDGERTARPRQLAMCTSNEDAVRTVVENVKRYIRENPRVKIVGVIVEDGEGMCECDICRRSDIDPNFVLGFRGYKFPEAENKNKAYRYARLVNRVAREIRGEFPDTLIGHAAYDDIQWPPRGVLLEPNVVTWVAIYWRDAANPLAADSGSPVNRFFFDILEQWKATQKSHVILYEYYMGMEAQKSLPYPMSEVICRDWPNLKKLGIEGATIQSGSTNHNAYGLNNLVFARTAWQDRVDHKKTFDDYLQGMFGAAAPEIRPIYERLIAALQRVEKEGTAVSPWMSGYDGTTTTGGSFLPDGYTIVYLLDQLGTDFLENALRRASAKASNDRERQQIKNFVAMTRYWSLAAEAFAFDLKAQKAEKAGDRRAAVSLLLDAAELCERVDSYLKTLPQNGWIYLTTPRQWPRLATDFRKRAQDLKPA
jgi:hypothetical protein